jgi:phage/plasmid-associated DNA primase
LLISHQGAGKNIHFTDVICYLLGEYANDNIGDPEDVTGKFNSLIEGKKLCVINEARDNAFQDFNLDRLKNISTAHRININQKGIPQRNVQHMGNYWITTNHDFPVKLEPNDRRMVVIGVSNEYAEPTPFDAKHDEKVLVRKDYFDALGAERLDPLFYPTLFTWFDTMDLAGFDPHVLPHTEAKLELAEQSKSPIERFLQDNAWKLKRWIPVEQGIFKDYMNWCRANHEGDPGSSAHFSHELRKNYGCEGKRDSKGALLRFTNEGQRRFH